MFLSKRDKQVKEYLKAVREFQSNLFEKVVFEYLNETLVDKINYLENASWQQDFTYYTEKDVKRMLKSMIKYNTEEELLEVSKEIREGYTLKLRLIHDEDIYTIVFNDAYLTINIIGEVALEDIEPQIYDKHFEMSSFINLDELLTFIHNEVSNFK